jgi:hypothetical protein
MGLDGEVCFDRYSRLGIYGYGDDEDVSGFKRPPPVNWDGVRWGQLQTRCFSRNHDRYHSGRKETAKVLSSDPLDSDSPLKAEGTTTSSFPPSSPQHTLRSAVLVRLPPEFDWTPNLQQYLRSLIVELGLHTGAEYEIFLLAHVNDAYPIHSDKKAVEDYKRRYIPTEFHDITVLFNNQVLELWYPKVGEYKYDALPLSFRYHHTLNFD